MEVKDLEFLGYKNKFTDLLLLNGKVLHLASFLIGKGSNKHLENGQFVYKLFLR